MYEIFLIFLITVLTGGLVWLVLEYKKLKQDYAFLAEEIERNKKDIAGLCSAAVSVDNQLRHVVGNIVDRERQKTQTDQSPYHVAIEMIRNGADAKALIQQCHLTTEEAVLLIRLNAGS